MEDFSQPPVSAPDARATRAGPPLGRSSHSGSYGRSSRGGFLASSSQPNSHIDSTVTKLLVATKQLLEGLVRWSQGSATEEDISTIYVQLGNDFNTAKAAFERAGIDMAALESVPSDLRVCLETCLSEEASPRTLEVHLPGVRTIIVRLLSGLKSRQAQFKEDAALRQAADVRRAREEEQERRPVGGNDDPRSAPRTQGPPASTQLTPNGAARSREDLRHFINQSQATSSFVSSTTTVKRGSSLGAPASTSTAGFPYPSQPAASTSRSSSYSGVTTPDERNEEDGTVGSTARASLSSRAIPPRVRKSSLGRRSVSAEEPVYSPVASTSTAPVPKSNLTTSLRDGFESARSSRSSVGEGSESKSFGAFVPAKRESVSSTTSGERRALVSPPPPLIIETPIEPLPRTPPAYLKMNPLSPISLGFPDLPSPPPANPTARVPRPPLSNDEEPLTPTDGSSQSVAQQAILASLKSSENLTRRASRRFSAYTSSAIMGVADPRSSPARSDGGAGRELSLAAGERGSAKKKSRNYDGGDYRSTPPKLPAFPSSSSIQAMSSMLRSGSTASVTDLKTSTPTIVEEQDDAGSDTTDVYGSPVGTLGSSPTASFRYIPSPSGDVTPFASASTSPVPPDTPLASSATQRYSRPIVVSSSVSSDLADAEFPISIFLQIGQDVKKAKLDEAPTLASLRLLFIELFQYNPGLEDFPKIYVRDPIVGVQYELEDLSEVKMRSVISLNIDNVQQVKSHIDQGLSSLTLEIKDLRASMAAMQRVNASNHHASHSPIPHSPSPSHSRTIPSSQHFHTAAQKVLSMKETPASPAPLQIDTALPNSPLLSASTSPSFAPYSAGATGTIATSLTSQHEEVQNIRREIGIIRQVYLDFANSTKTMISTVRAQCSHVQHLAATQVPSSRVYLEAGKARLLTEASALVVEADRVQDAIDSLSHDILRRKVRPGPGQVKEIAASLDAVKKSRNDLAAWLAVEEGTWRLTWMGELGMVNVVVAEQSLVATHLETLEDLALDFTDATDRLNKIQNLEQIKSVATPGTSRPVRNFTPAHDDDHRGLSTVILEVKGLQLDEGRRMDGIEEMERRRERENASRTDPLAAELGGFISGGGLKRTGGIEEAERAREARAALALKAMFSPPPSVLPPSLPPTPGTPTPVPSPAPIVPRVSIEAPAV